MMIEKKFAMRRIENIKTKFNRYAVIILHTLSLQYFNRYAIVW